MKIMKLLFLTFFFFLNVLIANDKIAKEIISLSKDSFYNLDSEQLTIILKPYLNKNKSIQALVLKDTIDDSIFLSVVYSNGKYTFTKKPIEIPQEINSFKSDIFYDDEKLGTLFLYTKELNTKVNFTKEEELWIQNNVVKVGVEPWAPVIFSSNGNDINGITGDILELMVQNSGLQLEVITDFWDPLLESFKIKEIDLLPATYYTEERATYGLYSKPYYKMLDYIYVKQDNKTIKSLNDLNGKKLAIPKGFGTIPKIKKKFPLINIVETQDLSDSIIQVLTGEVDALYEGQIAVEYKIQEDLITGLKGIPQSDFKAAELHFFSRNDNPLLQSILEKSLNSIPLSKINQIKSKWIINSSKITDSKNKIILSVEEQAFLAKHQTLRVSSETDYPPFDFFKENKPAGYSIDLLNLIAQKSGFNIEYVTDKLVALLKKIEKKEIDIIHTLQGSKEREKYLLFSEGFIKHQQAVFTHDSSEVKSYKDFTNKKIGLIKGEAITKILQNKNENFEIVLFDSYLKILNALSFKELDAIVVDLKVGQYTIKEEGLFNLKVVSDTSSFDEVKEETYFKIGIRNDYPILQNIINKGLKSISSEEYNALNEKWFGVSHTQVYKKSEQNVDISLIGILTFEEILFAIFLVCILSALGYMFYTKSNILSIKFKTFNILIIGFELSMIIFLVFEIIKLDRTENSLALAHSSKHEMIIVANRLVQSSHDLTKFARTYSITGDKQDKRDYTSTLNIRNGEQPRPLNYDTIYWSLSKKNRQELHPEGENISLRSLIEALPFTQEELNKLKESEDNSNDLVNLEIKSFQAVENNNNKLAIQLLHSKDYANAKQKIMLPIDEMIIMLNTRMNVKISTLNNIIRTQFIYILIVGLLFILGNILLYVLLRKKVNAPIDYLSNTILKIKNSEENIKKKTFYDDEIGKTIEQFFIMKDSIEVRTKELNTLFDSAPDSISIIRDGKYITCNQKTLEVFGINTIEELKDTLPSDHSPEFQENNVRSDALAPIRIKEAIDNGYARFEWKHKRYDTNEIFDAEVILSSIELNNKPSIYAVVRDITQRKKLEKKVEEQTHDLERQKERFELTVDGSGDGLWEYDYVEDKLWWSPRFIEMLGYKKDELQINNDTYFSHIHKDDLEKQKSAYHEHLKTDCIYDNTYRTIRKDGSYLWTRVRGKTLRDKEGRALKTSGSVVDVTEMENTKVQIEKSRNELKENLDELNRFQRLTVNRELKMIELKKEINQYLEDKGEKVKYKIVSIEDDND